MAKNNMFDQLKGYVEQLEKMSNAQAEQMQAYANPQSKTNSTVTDDYNDVLEKEFVKDEKGQAFARIQFEEAQKYLIGMFMATPEGKKLSEEREQAFRLYKDEKLKDFLESKKKKPTAEPAPETTSS